MHLIIYRICKSLGKYFCILNLWCINFYALSAYAQTPFSVVWLFLIIVYFSKLCSYKIVWH